MWYVEAEREKQKEGSHSQAGHECPSVHLLELNVRQVPGFLATRVKREMESVHYSDV